MPHPGETEAMFTAGRYRLRDGSVGTYAEALREAIAFNDRRKRELEAKLHHQRTELGKEIAKDTACDCGGKDDGFHSKLCAWRVKFEEGYGYELG